MRATEINSAKRMRQRRFRELADLLIEPPLAAYPILAFEDYRAIIDLGYQEAKERLAPGSRHVRTLQRRSQPSCAVRSAISIACSSVMARPSCHAASNGAGSGSSPLAAAMRAS